MKEVLFVRNSAVIISHDNPIKNRKEIAETLKDLNLSIAKNFKFIERNNFIIYIHLFKHLFSYSNVLSYYKPIQEAVRGSRYVGISAADLMFSVYQDYAINIFLCKYSNIYKIYYVNKSNIVIDLDNEYEIFTDDEVNRLISYSDKNIQTLEKIKNVVFINGHVYDEEVLTPIVVKYKGNKINIGFIHFSRVSYKPMIILHLSDNILKDRNVLGKLLSYFINISNFDFNAGSGSPREIYINFNKRSVKELIYNKINVDHEKVYDNIFNNITIGSDFEYNFMTDSGSNPSAYIVIDDYLKYYLLPESEDEYEEEMSELDGSRKIGVDGDNRTGECRTDVYNADENGYKYFIKEIQELIYELKDYADFCGYFITFSSEDRPTGMHLHIGFDLEERKLVVPNFTLLLDLSLGSYLVTLNTEVRLDSGYSNYNNYEIKSYGFEYRTLPSTILYNGLYDYVIEIYYKLIKYYFYKSYLSVKIDSDGKLSKKFFKKLLGKNTKKYFDLINELRNNLNKKVLYVEYPSLNAKTLLVKEYAFYNPNDYFTSQFRDFIINLNLNYVKNGIVYFYGLKKERGDNITTLDKKFEGLPESHYYYSKVPYLEDFPVIKFGIARNLREAEKSEEKYYLSEAIYKLLKLLEKQNMLIGKSEDIFKELCEKYDFNVEVMEKALA